MTAEVPFGENPFVDPESKTLALNDDWEIGNWVDVGLDSSSARLRLIKGGLGSTATETIIETKTDKPIEPWRIEAAKDLLDWLRAADKPHSVSEAIGIAERHKEEIAQEGT